VTALTVEDLSFTRRGAEEVRVAWDKGNRERLVPMGPRLRRSLRRYLKARDALGAAGGPPTEVAELQTVRATGTLQEFDLTTFEQQGVDLDDELYSEYQDRPVLVAGRVETTRGKATAP
jgi:hypothetical protein